MIRRIRPEVEVAYSAGTARAGAARRRSAAVAPASRARHDGADGEDRRHRQRRHARRGPRPGCSRRPARRPTPMSAPPSDVAAGLARGFRSSASGSGRRRGRGRSAPSSDAADQADAEARRDRGRGDRPEQRFGQRRGEADRLSIAIGSNSSKRTKPVPTQAAGTSEAQQRRQHKVAPGARPSAGEGRGEAERSAASRPAAPPGSAASEAASPSGSVTCDSAVRTGASRPFSVAWAAIAKTMSTVRARRLPEPEQHRQPRDAAAGQHHADAEDQPAEDDGEPGHVGRRKRWSANAISPAPDRGLACPERRSPARRARRPRAGLRSARSPATARRRQKRGDLGQRRRRRAPRTRRRGPRRPARAVSVSKPSGFEHVRTPPMPDLRAISDDTRYAHYQGHGPRWRGRGTRTDVVPMRGRGPGNGRSAPAPPPGTASAAPRAGGASRSFFAAPVSGRGSAGRARRAARRRCS